jgi:hypothetical protein
MQNVGECPFDIIKELYFCNDWTTVRGLLSDFDRLLCSELLLTNPRCTRTRRNGTCSKTQNETKNSGFMALKIDKEEEVGSEIYRFDTETIVCFLLKTKQKCGKMSAYYLVHQISQAQML